MRSLRLWDMGEFLNFPPRRFEWWYGEFPDFPLYILFADFFTPLFVDFLRTTQILSYIVSFQLFK
jgi:hypothetical protein